MKFEIEKYTIRFQKKVSHKEKGKNSRQKNPKIVEKKFERNKNRF